MDILFPVFAEDFTQTLDFKIIIVALIVAIVVGVLAGTLLGRRQKVKDETRIAQRRQVRQQERKEALKREQAIMERYQQAKEKGVEYDEAKYGPRPKETPDDYSSEPERPKKVQMIRASPAYVSVKEKPGQSGSAPVRVRDTEDIESQISGMKTRDDTASKKMAKAKPARAKPVAKVVALEMEDEGEEEEEDEQPARKEEVKVAVAKAKPSREEEEEEKRKEQEARKKKEEEEGRKKEERKKKAEGDDEDDGVDRLTNLMSALDGLKSEKK